jgi:hypothetical protein
LAPTEVTEEGAGVVGDEVGHLLEDVAAAVDLGSAVTR